MSRTLVLLSVGHIWRREPTRRRVVSWRVGPSRRPGKPALRSNSGAARRSYQSAASLRSTSCVRDSWDPRVTSQRPPRRNSLRAGFPEARRVDFTALAPADDPPCRRPPATARGVAGSVSGRAPFGVSPPPLLEKRREAEACAAVCREVTRTEALPEAGLVDRSDVANR